LIVPSYEYALVIENNVPKILKSGTYVIDSAFFVVEGFVAVNKEHIQHNTIHIVRVPKGKVALISENNRFGLLPQGTYTFNTQVFAYGGLRDINESCITHGTITRFRVRNGELGLAWHNNKPIFIEQPDFYEIDSPNFTFLKCVPASDKNVALGSRKRIIVYDGEVGISYVNGRLDILRPKTHVFDDAERIFYGFLSTRQQSLQLVEDGAKDHFLRCDTKDFVEVGLKACVFYKISDPEKGLLSVGDENAIAKLIKDTSIATLQSIMRSSGLNQVAQSKHVHAMADDSKNSANSANEGPSAPLFFDKVHDEFIFHLHDTFSKMYGIEIANIRIESFKIMNHALADNISQQAIITAQTETKLANLEGQREIATAEMERESEVIRIKAQSAAKQINTEAEARNNVLVADAKAKAQAAKIVAQGDADSLLIKAEAESKAIELKAAAERKRAEELSANPLGEKIAMMNIQAQMVTQSMQGVQKVIYLPSNANLAQMPIQLFGVPGQGVSALDESSFEQPSAPAPSGRRNRS
jgi:regulator of protease activity HflC (stomatin/prohibitin superfamily)